MKCKYCNAELRQGANFCSNCGKEVLTNDKCFNCGGHIKSGALFCPHCGAKQQGIESNAADQPIQETPIVSTNEEVKAEQPQYVEELIEHPKDNDSVNEEKNENIPITESSDDNLANTNEPYTSEHSSKKWLWILCVVLLLAILGGAWYLFNEGYFGVEAMAPTEEATDSIAETDESIMTIEEQTEIVETRLHEILSKLITEDGDEYLPEYFTEGFKTYYRRACDKALKEGYESPRIWWQESDFDPSSFKTNSVEMKSDSEAIAEVTISCEDFDGGVHSVNFNVKLKKENENWYIDEINEEKEGINESDSQPTNETTYNGTFSMVGKVSQYGIHMNIEIDGSSVKGYYYYDSQGSSNQVRLEGMIDDNGNMKLTKYGNDGEETGYFSGTFDGSTYSGENVNNKREENLPFSVSIGE